MTSLPPVGTTPGAQAANTVVAATATAGGAVTFVGPSGIQGSTITAVATVPLAPPTASFVGTLGTIGGQGVVVDTWGGDSTAGQFQILVGQTLVVTGTGLTPGVLYTCTFGTITDVGDVQTVIPTPNSSALTSSIYSVGVGSLIESLSFPTSGVAFGVTLPFGVRTVIVEIVVLAGSIVTNVEIVGNQSNLVYYNQPPYLSAGGGPISYTVVVPIVAAADTSVNVTITAGGIGQIQLVNIFGDTAQYQESEFYNGATLAASNTVANGTATVVTGPVRLLTAHLELDTNAAAGTGFLILGGTGFVRLDQIAAGNTGIDTSFTFPPNTILPTGKSLTVQSTVAGLFAIGGCTYAYP